ncbi:SMODS domain-containing nucleotidyltransferase [Aldersonia kunmingensis]|uniref:SMODS domain-containing nucleotidyltransferase n=1 Tax=Aldersonia kunmingensis TaxID=408066 RepID=UPI000ACE2D91|nr:hypothetical protein [Aldersonia kunmingensis]
MALTTAASFNLFYEIIKPTSALDTKVKQRTDSVVSSLKLAFPSTSNMRFSTANVVGSLGRGTASKPFSDVDLLVRLVVDQDLWVQSYARDSSKFLYRVRTSLANTSTVAKIGARGQAVRLFYSDGLYVDVAAVEKYDTGAFAIPDGTGGWLSTNPLKHAEYLNERNRELGGNLKRFIQVVKQWNRAHSTYLSSFHLEMLAARTFSTLGSNRRTALKVFFDYNHYNLSVQDPAGYSGDLSTYLTAGAREAVNANLASAYSRASSALAAEDRGDHREAIRLWRVILGSDFPQYG